MTIKQELQNNMDIYGKAATVCRGKYWYELWAFGIIRRYWIDAAGCVTDMYDDVGHYDPETMQIIDLLGC